MPAAALVLTTAYIVLAHLSPAALFPHLAHGHIMVWLAVAATLACLSQVHFHLSRWRTPQVYLMLGLTVSVPLSLAVNGLVGEALHGLREFLVSGIAFFLVLAAVDTVRKMHFLSFSVVLAAFYLLLQSLYGFYRDGIHSQYVIRQHTYNPQGDVIGEFPRLQAVGILNDPNGFAQFLLVAASLLTLAWSPGRRIRNVALVILPGAFLLYGVLITHSRGGLIGVAILAFFLLHKRFGTILSLAGSGGLLWLLFFLGAGGPRSISLADPATAGRIQVAETGANLFRSSPVFGVGFQQFTVHNPALTAHNSILLCLAELGIFGTLFWLGLIVFSILELNRMVRAKARDLAHSADAVRIALFTFLGTAMFLSRTYTMTLYVLIGMAAAAAAIERGFSR